MKYNFSCLILSLILATHTVDAYSSDQIKQVASTTNSSFEQKMKESRFQVSISSSNIKSDHNASTMVISCVDFRFQDENKFLLDNIVKAVEYATY